MDPSAALTFGTTSHLPISIPPTFMDLELMGIPLTTETDQNPRDTEVSDILD